MQGKGMSTRGLLGGKKGKERTGSISDEAIEHAYGLQVSTWARGRGRVGGGF